VQEGEEMMRADDTKILILAAGQAGHEIYWQDERERFLLPIAGEPLLMRTVRLCRQLGFPATIVTDNPVIQDFVERYFNPGPNRWVYDTIRGTQELWRKRTIFLAGDTLFYTDTLERILGSRETCSWEGTRGCGIYDVMAVVFIDEDWETVAGWLKKAHAEAVRRGHDELQILTQLGLVKNLIRDDTRKDVWDLDTVQIYEACTAALPWILGDEPQD